VSVRAITSSAVTLGLGFGLAGALYLALLNVPEANVPALLLSAALVVLIVLVSGLSAGLAARLPGEPWRAAVRSAARALPAFLLALAVFVALFSAVGHIETWWMSRRGEMDALLLPYIGTRSTRPLHTTIGWLLWLVRWGFGLSLVLGFVAAATSGSARRGIRVAVAAAPLAAIAAAAVLLSQGLWRMVYWRPEQLPATSLEIAFVALKLMVLYVAAALIAAMVVGVYRRAAESTESTTLSTT
jgi:hypothetical protein